MNIKSIIYLIIAAGWLSQSGLQAQSTNGAAALHGQLQALVLQVQAKAQDGKTTEADLADEFKALDGLIAGEKGAKTEEAAMLA